MSRLPRIVLALLLAGAAACTGPAARHRPPSVVLISIDTLRVDHLGCFGYDKPTSPRIDAVCNEAVVFEQAIAHAPSTLPSHASILTSLAPQHHQASFDNRRPLPESVTTLAEVLAEQGYRTAAFVGGGQIDPAFGLGQGFESYSVPAADDFDKTVAAGLEWIDGVGDEPFFLFLHTYEPHHPYAPSPATLALFDSDYDGPLPDVISVDLIHEINDRDEPLPPRDLAHVVAAYDAEIRQVDTAFGRLVEGLSQRGLLEPSLLVFTSDHGEEFGEHGYVGWHSHTTYDELLRVPLFFKFPKGGPSHRRIAPMVRGIDVAPTLLKAVGSRVPEQFSGIDLTAFLGAREVPPLTAVGKLDRPDGAKVSFIRDDRFKLERVLSPRQRLFDLAEDPGERWDTANNFPAEVGRLIAAYESFIASRPTAAGETIEPSDELRQQLEALGYIQ